MQQFFTHFLEAISPALQILIQSLAVALAAQASAWFVKKYQTAKMSLSTEQQYLLEIVVGSAIKAAEQIYDNGDEKRDFAFATVEKTLQQYGITMDVDVIYAMIETQVYDSFTKQTPAPALG
jgi:hypothetical protein